MKKFHLFSVIIITIAMGFYFTQCGKGGKNVKGGLGEGTALEISEPSQEPDSVRVYIDNSGSMRGYTEGENSVFVNAVSDLVSLKNGKAFFWSTQNPKPVNGLIAQALTNNVFNGQDTPFPNIFAKMEHEAVASNALTFIITDGIIGVNSKQAGFLKESLGQIKNEIRDSATVEEDMAVSIFRFESGYSNKNRNSYYYTHKNTPVKLDSANKRPFYVIAVGKRAYIQWLQDKVKGDEKLEKYQKAANITFGLHNHNTKLDFMDKKSFEAKGKIMQLKRKSGPFILKADMPKCLVNDLGIDYLKKNLIVKLNGEVMPNIGRLDKDDPQKGFYVDESSICVAYDQIRNISSLDNTLTISMKKTIPPQWTQTWNSDDDSNIARDMMEQQRTFALGYLLQGLYEATDGGKMLIETEIQFKK